MIKTPKEKRIEKEKEKSKLKDIFDFHTKNFTIVAATEEGREVFKYLMSTCGFKKNTSCYNPQTMEVNKDATVYLEARRSIYLEIRNYVPDRLLKKIEFK